MPKKLITLLGLVALSACSGSAPAAEVAEDTPVLDVATADSNSQFAGAWTLVKIERFDADGEPLAPPVEDQLGYIIYDPSGYMGVTIMQPDREPYAGSRTPEQALAAYSSYTSYFGRFTVNEAEGFLTHHLEGSLNTRGAGSDYKRFYTFSGNRLTLQPPAGANGNKTELTWEKLPDLPESELTETHKRLFGLYRIESVTRQILGGESLTASQYETAFIIYAPSGHMSVHLMRPGREPYAGTRPTPEDALAAVQTYGSYFGPFSVHEDEGYLVHERIGNATPRQTYTDAQRFYELTDTHLTLRPPATTNRDGDQVQSALRWARISN
jgi:hypothetical protein